MQRKWLYEQRLAVLMILFCIVGIVSYYLNQHIITIRTTLTYLEKMSITGFSLLFLICLLVSYGWMLFAKRTTYQASFFEPIQVNIVVQLFELLVLCISVWMMRWSLVIIFAAILTRSALSLVKMISANPVLRTRMNKVASGVILGISLMILMNSFHLYILSFPQMSLNWIILFWCATLCVSLVIFILYGNGYVPLSVIVADIVVLFQLDITVLRQPVVIYLLSAVGIVIVLLIGLVLLYMRQNLKKSD